MARIFHVAKIKLRGLCNRPSRDNGNGNNNNCNYNCKTPQIKQKQRQKQKQKAKSNFGQIAVGIGCLRDQTNDSI